MINNIYDLSKSKITRCITPENLTGERNNGALATEGTGAYCSSDMGVGWKVSPSVAIKAHTEFTLCDIKDEGVIRHIWITDNCPNNRQFIFRIYWDGSDIPSVEAPMNDFFASADLKQYRGLDSLLVSVCPKRGLNCFFEMPFKKGCRITIENTADHDSFCYFQIDYTLEKLGDEIGYLHAQYRQVDAMKDREVYTVLDNIKGKGAYIGTYMYYKTADTGWWGEGEFKFYLDGDVNPTICGTGTEDYFCGSYNFDVNRKYVEYSHLYCGIKVCQPNSHKKKKVRKDKAYQIGQSFSMYRWHVDCPIYFEKDFKLTVQDLGWGDDRKYKFLHDKISTVAYWYQTEVNKNTVKLPSVDRLKLDY